MTDVKPFVKRDSPPPEERSIAVVLVASDGEGVEDGLGLIDPLGPTCLFERALQCLEQVNEASERTLWIGDGVLRTYFENNPRSEIRLLVSPLVASLQPGATDGIRASHVLILDGRHPFLRPNTIDEAIRLMKIRGDIDGLQACVRIGGGLFTVSGEPMGSMKSQPVLFSCGAFSVTRAKALAYGSVGNESFGFEIAASEGFRVDSFFTQELAGAMLQERERRS